VAFQDSPASLRNHSNAVTVPAIKHFNMSFKNNFSNRYQQVFDTLKGILAAYERDLVVLVDQDDTYYVDASDEVHDQRYFFGAVQLRRDYVTFYFAGLPGLSELLRVASSDLCIIHNADGGNYLVFKTITTAQLKQLKNLLETYADPYALSFRAEQKVMIAH
jgi:hypothetical protein